MATIRHLGSGKVVVVDCCQVCGTHEDGGTWLASFFAPTGDALVGERYRLELNGEAYMLQPFERCATSNGDRLELFLALVLARES
jgi:hypothetical protein